MNYCRDGGAANPAQHVSGVRPGDDPAGQPGGHLAGTCLEPLARSAGLDVVAQSVYMTVMVCLLASSVNTIIASQRRLADEESAATQQEQAPSSAVSEPAKPALR